MAQNITKTSAALLDEARAAIPSISVEEALALHRTDTHVFVDVREAVEQARTGIIPEAVASSRSMMEFHVDPTSPMHKPALNQKKTYVFYCASGGRSLLASKAAADMGLAPVVNMAGGIGAWKKAGGPLSEQ